MIDYDILIAGGGVAGLAAAAGFGAAGFRVLLVDPSPPVTDAGQSGADLRTTAFLQPARDFLQDAGLWERLLPHARPLERMRIVDAGGDQPIPRVTRDFDSAEIGGTPFGWNFPNWLLRREILARLADLPDVTLRHDTGFHSLLAREEAALVRLGDGTGLRVRLVVGADGRNSMVRQSQGIGAHVNRYGQKAVVFAVTHPAPHGNISTEVHRSGGPFTLVPLPDHQGQPCSSVVWMERGIEATRLMALDDRAFSEAATERSAWVQGPLTLASPRQVWPIIAQRALALTAPRVALIAEAAHVVPPIGAQGLNMSMADLTCLRDLATARPGGLGDAAMLSAYASARQGDTCLRVAGVDLLNRASMTESPPLRDLRALGLRLLHDVAPLRRGLMRLGLGADSRD